MPCTLLYVADFFGLGIGSTLLDIIKRVVWSVGKENQSIMLHERLIYVLSWSDVMLEFKLDYVCGKERGFYDEVTRESRIFKTEKSECEWSF